jgi:hypothetical protein
MLLKRILRKLLLSIMLGGHSFLGLGMSSEKIEELLHSMHQTRAEVTIPNDQNDDLPAER